MNWKFALILAALVASSTLVAPSPAQQQPSSDRPATFTLTTPTQPAQPPPPPPITVGVPTNLGPRAFYQVESGDRVRYLLGNAVPDDANLGHEAEQLVRQLGEAKSDSDRDKLKAKLGEVLEKQFDHRQKRHEHEIEQLEAQVKKLKDLVAKRQENRREIIGRRLEQILRESQGLGW